MSFLITRDPDAFSSLAGPFLERRIECNVLATVLMGTRDGAFRDAGAVFAYSRDSAGQICAAALRVPPWPLLISALDEHQADELVARWLDEDRDAPGVSGPAPGARAVAAAWAARTGTPTRVRMHEALHVLEHVEPPPHPVPGELRLAAEAEVGLVAGWMNAFAVEAGVIGASDTERLVHARIARGGFFVWDHAGAVSLLGMNPAVAGVARIGPVYTPPEQRRRGYAGNAVAAASRRALEAGAERCMLFTDLANPTSNKIYAEVGYRFLGDWEEHEFVDQPAAS